MTGFALGGIIILTLFHLLAIGLPPKTIRHICSLAQEKGIPLRIESIRLFPHRGWALQNVQIFNPSPDVLKPLLKTKVIYVHLFPEDWSDLKHGGWHIRLNSRDIDLSLGQQWDEQMPPGHSFRTLKKMRANLHIRPGEIAVDSASALWNSLQIEVKGLASRSTKKSSAAPDRLTSLLKHANRIADTLNRIDWEPDSRIDLSFASSPETNTLNAALFIKEPVWDNHIAFEQLSGNVTMKGHMLRIKSFELAQQNGSHLIANGSFNAANQTTELELENTFPTEDLLPLLPVTLKSSLSDWEIEPSGPLTIHATFGPAVPKQLLHHIQATVHNLQITRKDLTLDSVSFSIKRDNEQLELQSVRANANGGNLTGDLKIHLPSRAILAHVDAHCDPHPIGTLVGGGLLEFINRFSFNGAEPAIKLTVSHEGKENSLSIQGILAGSNVTCADVPIDRFQTDMVYSNHVLKLTRMDVAGGDQRFKGNVHIDFTHDTTRFDAETSFKPPVIAQIIVPGVQTILNEFQFNGPFYAKGRGQIDYGTLMNHSYDGEIQAEYVVYKGYETTRINSSVVGRGPELTFTNCTMQIYGGKAKGTARFDLFSKDSTTPYHIRGDISQLDLATFLQKTSNQYDGKTVGTLSGNISLKADASRDFWDAATGRGRVSIANGRLADIPLLGGLSKRLRNTIPGFSFFSITSLSSDFEIKKGAFLSDQIKLGGNLLSAQASGQYSPQSGLNFIMQGEPLRQSSTDKDWYQVHLWAADVLKWGSAPLFRLFEFKLSGTLNNPTWHFVNLPSGIPFIQNSKTDTQK